jgi:hypothetical protein
MIIVTDICPKSGLKREIDFIKVEDDIVNKKIFFDCNILYFSLVGDLLGINLLPKDKNLLTISNDNTLNGIGEYDYWKGFLNDFQSLINKNIPSYDACVNYVLMKAYLDKKFD